MESPGFRSHYQACSMSSIRDRSPSQLSEISSSGSSWHLWRTGGRTETRWQTNPQRRSSPVSCDSGAFESDSSTSSTDTATDGWSSETSDPADDDLCRGKNEGLPCSSKSSLCSNQPCVPSQQMIHGRRAENASYKARDRFFTDRKPRKQRRPEKSAKRFDPRFRGVMLKFKTKVDSSNWRSKLSIRSYFSCHKRTRNCRYHHHDNRRAFFIGGESSSSSESELDVNVVRKKGNGRQAGKTGKQCASCGTKKTPLWRDAEDGTPLCNACGIRYKKYRIRCNHCWYVPRKSSKAYPICSNCGERVQLSQGRTKFPSFMLVTKFGKIYKKPLQKS